MEYPQDTTNKTGLLLEQSLIIKKFNQLIIYQGYSKRLWWESNPQQLEGIELNNDMLSLLYS